MFDWHLMPDVFYSITRVRGVRISGTFDVNPATFSAPMIRRMMFCAFAMQDRSDWANFELRVIL